MRTNKRPGYNAVGELFSVKMINVQRMVDRLLKFIKSEHLIKSFSYADIGLENPKMNFIKERTDIKVDQIVVEDFNFDLLPKKKKYDVIFCFEIIEHLQNPLFFIRELKSILKDNGVIYLTTPSNPKWLKYEYHFNEMNREILERWIFTPEDLKIERHWKFNFMNDWRAMFFGIRPIIRAIRNGFDFRPIFWGFVQINNFYEIRKT